MADLIAQGKLLSQRWRRALPSAEPIIVGRAARGWAAPWDGRISREHVEVYWDGNRLRVRQLPAALNPVFVQGQQSGEFLLAPGEHFVIGESTFTLSDERAQASLDVPQPVQQQVFSPQYLQRIQFRHADPRIEVLSRLPEVVSTATGDMELYLRLVSQLLAGVPRASAAALVKTVETRDGDSPIQILHWDRRLVTGDDFQPSEKLIREAIHSGQSVLHVWDDPQTTAKSAFTANQGIDWAFCTPVGGKSCPGWAFYVAGRFIGDSSRSGEISDPTDLRDDLKFAELAASTVSSLRDVQVLERQRAGFLQFFSPVVLEALATEDPEVVLAPRETEVTVMFCDLRGFSRRSEQAADNLLGLLKRVSDALGVTTHSIREQGGVVGDFQGDAAMGFWGWPLPQSDAALRACRAALAIRQQFTAAAQNPNDPLANFQVGIGIATGRAVAGKIGTADQVKITVFGPVVNLASRLEGMTKVLSAPILVDATTAAAVGQHLARHVARLRRVAVVRPYGLDKSVSVTELLSPAESEEELTDAHLADYERALDEMLSGRWDKASEKLQRLSENDRVKDFLLGVIQRYHHQPPEGWNGVISLSSK